MMTAPPIPAVVWQRIRAFLAAGLTGQIVLEVRAGQILGWRLTEHWRLSDLPSRSENASPPSGSQPPETT